MSQRIYTRCPACFNDTLTINEDKHLLCTWVDCPDPTLIDRPSPPAPGSEASLPEILVESSERREWRVEVSRCGGPFSHYETYAREDDAVYVANSIPVYYAGGKITTRAVVVDIIERKRQIVRCEGEANEELPVGIPFSVRTELNNARACLGMIERQVILRRANA